MWAKLDQPDAVYYDITWTGFCGAEIPDKYTNIFEIVSAGRDRAIERERARAIRRQRDAGGEYRTNCEPYHLLVA